MTTQNSSNTKITNNADGFDIAGGTTPRKLTISGGDITAVGGGSAVITMPASTGTLAKITDTLAKATTLETARTINGTSFDGSANITFATGQTYQGYNTVATPVDATTYYFGSTSYYGASTSAGFYRFRMLKAGTITRVIIDNYYGGTQPTTETSTVYLKVNAGGNVTVLNNTFHNDVNAASYSNLALSTAVAQGDYVEFNWVTPTWATNPGTAVYLKTFLYVE